MTVPPPILPSQAVSIVTAMQAELVQDDDFPCGGCVHCVWASFHGEGCHCEVAGEPRCGTDPGDWQTEPEPERA